MGWGITRLKVYDLLLRLTREALDGQDSSDEKSVSKLASIKQQQELNTTSARERACHSMDSRDDQAPRRRCSCQDYAWVSIRECISSSRGKAVFHDS